MNNIIKLKDKYKADCEEVILSYRNNSIDANGLILSLSRATDNLLNAFIQHYPLPPQTALCAVGGYGREQMFPYSDVDLLIITPDEISDQDTEKLERLVTAFWDLGLKIGYSVRTIAQCLEEAHQDIATETSFLDIRFLAGDKTPYDTFNTQFWQQFDAGAFFLAKKLELQQRYQRFNDTPFVIEPNCKESPGALRDIHLIHWLAKAAKLGSTWEGLIQAGLMLANEAKTLTKVEHEFIRLRVALHLLAKKNEDRLIYDWQPQLAEIFKLGDSHQKRPSEILMRNYYWGARIVYQLMRFLLQSFQDYFYPNATQTSIPIDEHFFNRSGRLDIYDQNLFIKKPEEILRTFIVMADHPEISELHVNTARAIWKAGSKINKQFRENPVNKKQFIEIFKRNRGIVHNLRRMIMLDVLPRYLPVFKKIVGMLQHDHYHIYTVDQHTIQVIRHLRRYSMDEHAQEDPFASAVMNNFEHPWLLYLAALFHDIAKGRGGDHSELGAIDAENFARSHYLSESETELMVFLVKEHLFLSATAQKRDLSDPEVIQHFVQKVKDEQHLSALYLLTISDIQGTSPKVMTQWKSMQINQLYQTALAYMGGKSHDNQSVLSQRKQEAAHKVELSGILKQDRDTFWNAMDVAYFLRHTSDEIAWHTRILHPYMQKDDITIIRSRPLINALQIMVYTHDKKNLFEIICAYFYKRKINILEAKIHTCPNQQALDSFLVTSPQIKEDARSCASIIEVELQEQLLNPQLPAIGTDFTFGERHRRLKTFPLVPTIDLSPDEKNANWRLDLVCINMPGVLYTMSYYFAKYHIEIKMAKVMTLGDRVEDVFILNGQALNNPRTQLDFKRDVLDALSNINPYKS
ncbi:[protein-PII] uridylyltransferase [Basilea psittacipulmonis]|uniref:Bifunctional uridylyltransferase/uridylyl-removing enzyme n=1 Tax=Basilea psittacipulmonis DSM 24701 TaxID=1072685 RepID=A0A077DEN6_9BURK|nr:[protein-PII] uridylyltransferase [Basilea psittacipulmonis]AIL32626.1 hypothetical protein IX83_04285 [Basilea psittacipulmonis DSM 24701]